MMSASITSHGHRVLLLATVLATAALAAPAARAADARLNGVVKSADGKAMSGVTVSARADGRSITTSVYTDAHGEYYFPPLPTGNYRVWAQALTFATGKSEAALDGAKRVDFTLSPMADFVRQLPGDELQAALPEATPEEQRLKRIVHNNCTGCHTPSYILQHRFDEAGWTAVMDLMKHVNVGGVYQGEAHKANAIIESHEPALAAYLAAARGPGPTSMKFKLQPRPSGEAARVVVTEYSVPLDPAFGAPGEFADNDGSDWSLGTPSGKGVSGVHDAWADNDGNIWFTYNAPSRDTTVGRIDKTTGAVKHFKVNGIGGLAAPTHGLTRDRDGILWFSVGPTTIPNHGGLGRIDPKTEQIEVFQPPADMSGTGGATTVDFDGKGKIWISSAPGVLRFDPVTKEWTEFKSTTYKTPNGTGMTYGVAADRNGNGWWAEMALDIVDKADFAAGQAREVRLAPIAAQEKLVTPAERAVYDKFDALDFNTPYPWGQGPRRMGSDKAADIVWVGDSWGGNLARIDTLTQKTTYVPTPNPATLQPYQVIIDSKHRVWTNSWVTDKFLRLDPKTGKWTVFELPTRGTEARYISLSEKDGKTEVVLPYFRTRKVAVVAFRSEAEIAALRQNATAR
jgi:streptogramin lyase